MSVKAIKKILNIEYDLTSDEFIDQKMVFMTDEIQRKYNGSLVKVTTYCTRDKELVVSTTPGNAQFIGAPTHILERKHISQQALSNLDNEMLMTFEITIMNNSTIDSYESALNVAQASSR